MKNYTFFDPSVKILNPQDLKNGLNLWIKSRKDLIVEKPNHYVINSELIDKQEYFENITKQNLQYNNFSFVIFEIKGSILFRDFLYSIPGTAQWSVSTRLTPPNPENLSISSEVSESSEIREICSNHLKDYFKFKIDKKINFDEYRKSLPYMFYSTYWVGIPLKIINSVLAFILNKFKVFDLYAILINNELKSYLGFDMMDVSWNISNFDKMFLGKKVLDMNPCYKFKGNIRYILFSQMLRQSDTILRGLYDNLNNMSITEISKITGRTELEVELIQDDYKFKKTLSTRLCAFSMSGGDNEDNSSWNYILKDWIQQNCDFTIWKALPCVNSLGEFTKCKFKEDMELRNETDDSFFVPCPVPTKSIELAERQIKSYGKNAKTTWYLNMMKHLNK